MGQVYENASGEVYEDGSGAVFDDDCGSPSCCSGVYIKANTCGGVTPERDVYIRRSLLPLPKAIAAPGTILVDVGACLCFNAAGTTYASGDINTAVDYRIDAIDGSTFAGYYDDCCECEGCTGPDGTVRYPYNVLDTYSDVPPTGVPCSSSTPYVDLDCCCECVEGSTVVIQRQFFRRRVIDEYRTDWSTPERFDEGLPADLEWMDTYISEAAVTVTETYVCGVSVRRQLTANLREITIIRDPRASSTDTVDRTPYTFDTTTGWGPPALQCPWYGVNAHKPADAISISPTIDPGAWTGVPLLLCGVYLGFSDTSTAFEQATCSNYNATGSRVIKTYDFVGGVPVYLRTVNRIDAQSVASVTITGLTESKCGACTETTDVPDIGDLPP